MSGQLRLRIICKRCEVVVRDIVAAQLRPSDVCTFVELLHVCPGALDMAPAPSSMHVRVEVSYENRS